MNRTSLILICSAVAYAAACVPSIPPCGEAHGTEGIGPFPDEAQLDRTEDCKLSEDPDCAYPGGPYGFSEGDVIDNFVVKGCDGQDVEFAEFLNRRADTGELNRGVILALGAGWCVPCQEEAMHFAEIAAEHRDEGIEFIHLLHQDFQAPNPPNADTCSVWYEDLAQQQYPILYDPTDSVDELIKPPGDDSLPWVLAVDANGHIRFKEGGQAIDPAVLDSHIKALVGNPYGN